MKQEGKPLLFTNLPPDPKLTKEIERFLQANLVASFPLLSKGELLGTVIVGPKLRGELPQETDFKLNSILTKQASASIENARLFEKLQSFYRSTIQALVATIDAKDPSTAGHTKRTSRYATKIAERMRFSQDKLAYFTLATLLHDIGKIAISESLLRRTETSPINSEQLEEIHTHPKWGAEILEKIEFLRGAADLARHHHERFDGKGYPDGLKGKEISLEARILAVADSYDAMTTIRRYKEKPRLSKEEAMEELERCAGTQFDPEIVRVFLSILQEEDSE